MATVTFENVSKRFGDVVAVDDLNLDIRDAEFMVLVGPSGCGKTTSLRMIAGLEEITSGTLRIGDRVINDIPPKDRDIAMVFQNYALYRKRCSEALVPAPMRNVLDGPLAEGFELSLWTTLMTTRRQAFGVLRF